MQWFNDSSDDIRSCCDKALQTLRTHYGWEVRKTLLPTFSGYSTILDEASFRFTFS